MESVIARDAAKINRFLAADHESSLGCIATHPASGMLHEVLSYKINLRGNWLVASEVGDLIWDTNAELAVIIAQLDLDRFLKGMTPPF